MWPYTSQEIFDALQSMAPNKSLGIDGMSVMFYLRNWDIVGPLDTGAMKFLMGITISLFSILLLLLSFPR